MPEDKNHKKESLDNLFDAFTEALHPTKEDLKKELSSVGIDPDKVSKEGMSFVHKLQARAKIELAKQDMFERVTAAKDAIRQLAPKLSPSNREMLAKILFGEEANVAVNFNKISELNDEDIIDMLNEVQLLDFLESLKK